MNIVMATHHFPRAEGDLSGASIWRLAAGLVDRGHNVTVVAPADHGDVGEPMLGNVRVRRFRYGAPSQEFLSYQGPMRRRALTPLGLVSFARLVRAMGRAVTEEVRATTAHVIHAHYWMPGGLAVRLCDRAGRPFVVTMHGTGLTLSRHLPLGLTAMTWVLRDAAVVTGVSSQLTTAAARAMDVPASSLSVTPMPIALGHSPDPDSARHGVIYVGRLARNRGVNLLLEAAAILKREGTPIDLTIVGDGPERSALKAQAIALGVTVFFTGYIAPELVAGQLRDKRAFVFPALESERGLAIAEALIQGVPVVATRVGAATDFLFDPDAGVIVPPGDPLSLALALRMVLKEERFRVGAYRCGRTLAIRLSAESVATEFEGIYRAARSRRSGPGQRQSGTQRPSGPTQRPSGESQRPSGESRRPSGPTQRPSGPAPSA
jgi:glycosyltransferase involved in cell wall biosynthesis